MLMMLSSLPRRRQLAYSYTSPVFICQTHWSLSWLQLAIIVIIKLQYSYSTGVASCSVRSRQTGISDCPPNRRRSCHQDDSILHFSVLKSLSSQLEASNQQHLLSPHATPVLPSSPTAIFSRIFHWAYINNLQFYWIFNKSKEVDYEFIIYPQWQASRNKVVSWTCVVMQVAGQEVGKWRVSWLLELTPSSLLGIWFPVKL